MTRFNVSILALLFACATNGCSGSGPTTDTDGDGTSDAKDLCTDTAAGEAVGADGCGTAEDGDRDGVSTESDLCPHTAAGAAVDAFGCSAEQRKAGAGSSIFRTVGSKAPSLRSGSGGASGSGGSNVPGSGGSNVTGAGGAKDESPSGSSGGASGGSPGSSGGAASAGAATPGDGTVSWAQAILDNPPENGTVENGFVSLVVLPKSAHPMVLEAWAANVTETSEGYQIGGSLFLTTPLGMIPIANASVTLAYGADRTLGLQTVRGDASVPFPGIGLLGGVKADDLVSASVGLDVGANLTSLGAPLVDDRSYLFFNYHQGFKVSAGPVSFEAPDGQDGTLVLDPSDPFVFLKGSMLGLDALGPVEDVGIGVSLRGLIPFAPTTTWGLANGLGAFDGHLYLGGSIPLGDLPMTLSGQVVVDLDPEGGGEPIWDAKKLGGEVGMNGSLDLSVPFRENFSFDANIGNASVGLKITDGDQRAYFSGVVAPDQSFLPAALPLKVNGDLSVAGLVSKNLDQSYLRAEGHFTLDGGGLGELSGLSLDDLVVAGGRVEISKAGFHLAGNLDAGIELTKELSIGADAHVDAEFAGDSKDFHVDIDGDVQVSGVNLAAARVRIASDGIAVAGTLDNGVTKVTLSGTITKSKVELHGEASVTIDVKAGKDVVNAVTDGALCGYETVRDGVLCGYEVVTSGATCGYEVVTDGATCGYQVVTDGAVCGYEAVTNAAVCGSDAIADAAVCGWGSVCSAVLGWTGACKDVPNTCSVPRTCADLSAPKTCANFNMPKTCDNLAHPRTCDDLGHPKTCEDLSKPRTCDQHHLVPDFDFGSVQGTIAITLGSSGLSGQVTGEYCATDDSCTTVAGGRLAVGDPMQACIDVPGDLGEFCAKF